MYVTAGRHTEDQELICGLHPGKSVPIRAGCENTVHWSYDQKRNLKHYYFSENPLSPHDALKHHFTALKTDLIFLQPRVLE